MKQNIELEIVFVFGFKWPNKSLSFLCNAKKGHNRAITFLEEKYMRKVKIILR